MVAEVEEFSPSNARASLQGGGGSESCGDDDCSGLVEHCFLVSLYGDGMNRRPRVVEKFDTAASCCMSGVPDRIVSDIVHDPDVRIAGFNQSISRPSVEGLNADGKKEYFVPNMPADLVLLCAAAYAADGAVVLFKDSGVVLRLSEDEVQQLRQSLRNFSVAKKLIVKNRTYEVKNDHACREGDDQCYACDIIQANQACREGVDLCYACDGIQADTFGDTSYTSMNEVKARSNHSDQVILQQNQVKVAHDASIKVQEEVANSSTAALYFNTKVHVNNGTDRVLTLLLMGLSFNDWYLHVKNNSLGGIPPDVNLTMLNSFQNKYGRTPDLIRMAIPVNRGSRNGLMDEPAELTKPGERVECDLMEWDFNEVTTTTSEDAGRVSKLATHGGAIAAYVAVDCFSGNIFGKLVKTTGNTQVLIEDTVVHWELKIAFVSSGSRCNFSE